MFLNVIRDCCGANWSPEEVHFEHPKPPSHKEHESAFGAPVYFAQGTNALLFRPEILARPMPGRDPRLFAMMEICLENIGNRPRAPESLSGRLRSAIRARLAQGYPTLDEVAGAVRISPNTIQRQLARDGLAYKDLVEGMRQDLALTYVKQRHLPFSEIAFLLGYSELSAFSRAFRRWTGASPRAFRAKLG
jgi:AraC-like DNA-binding protein